MERTITLLLALLQAAAVVFVLFHLYARSPAFRPVRPEAGAGLAAKLSLYVFFSGVCILGTWLGQTLTGGAIANTRAMGAVLAGLLGGPWMGGAVAATAGVHRLSLGGFTAPGGVAATLLEGVVAGLVRRAYVRRGAAERVVSWPLAFALTAAGEVVHMLILLAVARPFDDAVAVVKVIGLPMIAANSAGAALFMTALRERYDLYDRVGAVSSAKALRIAERTLGPLAKGFTGEAAEEMAAIIREETGVGAVAITDVERVLAFTGAGSDHHRPGSPIASPLTRRALADREVVFADGVRERYACTLAARCPLRSAVIVPLEVDGAVVGTVQLLEPSARRFRSVNRSLGEGLADLLSEQLLRARYQEQKSLLTVAELKLVQAQVNPHFLFNSLNTIIAVTRTDPDRARELLAHLSNFFRKNLKRAAEWSTLAEELDHVQSYLEIEKARFRDRLVVELEIAPELLPVRLPTFTLQPLLENAVKHGLAHRLEGGRARIRARAEGSAAVIEVEDDGGAWPAQPAKDGLGMRIVDERIKGLLGKEWGVSVDVTPRERTRVTVRVPLASRAA